MTPRVSAKCPESVVCPECGTKFVCSVRTGHPCEVLRITKSSFIDTDQDDIADAFSTECRNMVKQP